MVDLFTDLRRSATCGEYILIISWAVENQFSIALLTSGEINRDFPHAGPRQSDHLIPLARDLWTPFHVVSCEMLKNQFNQQVGKCLRKVERNSSGIQQSTLIHIIPESETYFSIFFLLLFNNLQNQIFTCFHRDFSSFPGDICSTQKRKFLQSESTSLTEISENWKAINSRYSLSLKTVQTVNFISTSYS